MSDAPRRRVAHVTLGLDVGGQERMLVELARHRNVERFDWTVIALGQRGVLAEPLEAAGVRVVVLDEPPGFRIGLFRRLAKMFRAEHFDIVHTHDDRPLIYGMPAAWWAGVPCRIHTHHHGRLPGSSARRRFLIRRAARFAHHFVCVSDDSARFMIEEGVRQESVRTIHNGIDLAHFAFHGPSADGPIVTVARLSPEKDVANLLRAAAFIPDTRFEIAGAGPCRAELGALAAELGISARVLFHGEVRDIPALLARARLFVLPSQTEGISLTLLEAMARGLPVVATAVGGTPEVVQNGVTGLLVPPRDPSALAQAILALCADAERGRVMGQAGRARAESAFDIRAAMRQYESLYGAAS